MVIILEITDKRKNMKTMWIKRFNQGPIDSLWLHVEICDKEIEKRK